MQRFHSLHRWLHSFFFCDRCRENDTVPERQRLRKEDVSEQLKEKDDIIKSCEKQKLQLQKEKQELQKEYNELKERSLNSEKAYNQVHRENEKIQKKCQSLEKRYAGNEERCRQVQQEKENIQKQYDEVEGRLNSLLQSQNLNCEKCDTYAKELKAVKQEKEEISKIYHNLKRSDQQSCQNCYQKSEQLEKVKQEMQELKKAHGDLQKRMKINISKQMQFSGQLSENINDPCRESELVKMYNHLKKQIWPREKERYLKKRKSVEINKLGALVLQMSFQLSPKVIEERMRDIATHLLLNQDDLKDDQNQQLFKENKKILQRRLHSCDLSFHKEEVKRLYKDGQLPEMEWEDFAAECFKVGSLMFLHDPSLVPQWESQADGYTFEDGKKAGMLIFPAISNGSDLICPAEIVSYNLG
ncbi:reticulocyte-binding protein homolog 2a-like [Erpetoichthys calabaricus]|uniref:reticulocyte-binding protein homolog 2a-like n=1 Tax=Erpetoichthys calabaricus TaxID=27687 RepID=UPI00109F2DAF|nr:reticulocyte-binding protein homolog 2a-like [Erpetoichthys calabaricus]